MTLNIYSRVQLDEAKQEFARIDFTGKPGRFRSGASPDLVATLVRQIPPGKEGAFVTLLRGLIELLQRADIGTSLYTSPIHKSSRKAVSEPRIWRLAAPRTTASAKRKTRSAPE